MNILLYRKFGTKFDNMLDLVSQGNELTIAAGVEDFSRKFEQNRIDLVLIECEPGDGIVRQLINLVNSAEKVCPVIGVLAEENESQALELLKIGIDDVVFKNGMAIEELHRTFERSRARKNALSRDSFKTILSESAINNTFDGVFALDLDSKLVFWNRSMERMFASKSSKVLGRTIDEVIAFKEIRKEVDRAFRGEAFSGNNKIYFFRDQRRVCQSFYAPLSVSDGTIIGVLGVFRDVTKLHEKDHLNHELNQRLLEVADNVPQMLWFANARGERNFFNKKYLDFVGVEPKQLLSEGWLMTVHSNQRDRYLKELEAAIKNRRGFHMEYHMRDHENNFRRVLDSCSPVKGEDGTFLGLIGYCTDLTETETSIKSVSAISKKTRSFSEMSGNWRIPSIKEKVVSTLENAPIGVWKLDKNLVIRSVSDAALKLTGLDEHQLKGQKITRCIENIPEGKLIDVLEQQSTFQLDAFEVNIRGNGGNGKHYWDLAAWPLLDQSRNVMGVCISTIAADNPENDKSTEAFVATLVHDLKTPLIGADRTLELLINGSMGDVEQGQSEILTMLQRSNRGLLRMVQNLIEVYRFDFTKPKFEFASKSLFELAQECANELSAVANEKSVSIETNLIEKTGIVRIDELAIKRVILNIIDNAIKFTPAGGTVRVWGEETPNMVSLFVKDTGIGIEPQEISMLFNKFWRSPNSTGNTVGTGLGLYLCKKVIDSHNGEIKVEAQLNQGTLVKISLLP